MMEYYGVTFDEIHTSYWDLLWEGVEISYPDVKTYAVDVPGTNGSIDLTEILTPVVKYGNRSISFVFSFLGDYGKWHSILNQISNYLHGRIMRIITDSETDYYYVGRLRIDTEKTDDAVCQLTISGTVDPYKYELLDSLDDWLWDPFNFETGVIRQYKNIVVSGSKKIVLTGNKMPVCPVFSVSANMTMDCDGKIYHLLKGRNQIYGLYIRDGDTEVIFHGTGSVSIEFRGGKL